MGILPIPKFVYPVPFVVNNIQEFRVFRSSLQQPGFGEGVVAVAAGVVFVLADDDVVQQVKLDHFGRFAELACGPDIGLAG